MVEFDMTYRCNCRCEMCQRWRDSRSGEMTLNDYRKLADAFSGMGVHLVSMAGGEPLLRKDIFTIIKAFARHGMAVNLCTNGILLNDHVEALCNCGAAFITVSIDGAAPETHEAIRGAPGTFCRIDDGIRSIMARPPSTRPLVRVRMTVSNRNLKEVRAFYHIWKNRVDDVLLQPVHHCGDSYYTGLDAGGLCLDPSALEAELAGTPMEKDGYMHRLVESLRKTGTFPKHRCYAGVLMVRIDPWGNVYPCLEQHVRIGSLRETDFPALWYGDAFNRERIALASNGTCSCWYNNTAMISHYGKLLYQTTAVGLLQTLQHFLFGKSVAFDYQPPAPSE